MTPEELSHAIAQVLTDAVAAGELNVAVPDDIRLERPKNRDHGDWATNVALQLAKPAGQPPRTVAELLAARLRVVPGLAAVDVAGPGFINLTLDVASAGELARAIVMANHTYGSNTTMAGQRVNLEFVSANPTGPIHLGGARWAAVGDSLARIMQASGAFVTREYYFNDHGGQIDKFARSLLAAARGEAAPEDGYGGQYIADIAADVQRLEVNAGQPDPASLAGAQAQEVFRDRGVKLMFAQIKESLKNFGVLFDVYFHEDGLHTSGAVDRAVQLLRERDRIFEFEGATWVRTTDLGDDKDRPIVKSDGETTYFAADLAYYRDKRDRGYDPVIIMLGADHHGYVPRMMAMCAAFGDEPNVSLQILIGQMVNLVQGGEPVRMSKRAGTVVTLDDLVEAVGVDAARYSLARYSVDSSIDIDVDVLTKHSNDNPVYYVQYAHARVAGVLRNAADAGIRREDGFDPVLLTDPTESVLLAALAEFPSVVAQAAELREPHRVARYAEELAGHFHKWYDACRVIPQDADDPVTALQRTRLWLATATGAVLANALGLLGVSAPDRM